jgi:predicted dehydrogenase
MLNVGLIGYGYWGPNLARNIAEADGVHLAAIAESNAERQVAAARRHQGISICGDAAGLLAADDLDALVIATPLSTHYQLAKAAIERDKHVLIEKPLAPSRGEAEELGELAERRGVTLMVDHTFVFTGAVRTIRTLTASGELGELLYFDSVRANLGPFRHDSNVIWDLAAHDFAIMDYLIASRPVSVSVNGAALAGYPHENVAYIMVHFDQGLIGHFHVNWLSPLKIRHMLIGGRKRMVAYNDMEPSEKVRVYDCGVDLGQDGDNSCRTGDVCAPSVDQREALAIVVREFADAIEVRREPLTGAQAGIRVVALLEAAERSLRAEGRCTRL